MYPRTFRGYEVVSHMDEKAHSREWVVRTDSCLSSWIVHHYMYTRWLINWLPFPIIIYVCQELLFTVVKSHNNN